MSSPVNWVIMDSHYGNLNYITFMHQSTYWSHAQMWFIIENNPREYDEMLKWNIWSWISGDGGKGVRKHTHTLTPTKPHPP